MANIWVYPSTISLGTIYESSDYSYSLPLTDSSSTTTQIIAGSLPPGLRLDNNIIYGMPYEVVELKTFKFVIRAVSAGKISDRTFTISIDGSDEPEWISEEGLLPVGPNDNFYVLDESYIDFQLLAIDTDTIAGQTLSFWIDPAGGVLPPGLSISNNGRIYGFIKPLPSQPAVNQSSGYYDSLPYDTAEYDKGTINTYGFGTYGYDFLGYDYSEFYAQPKKLNRTYEFIVNISDGNTVSKRKFRIFVMGDDSFFTDNEVIHVGSTQYTSDISSLREPIWMTDSDLGIIRASNYQTLKLDIYDVVATNPIIYSLDVLNPDRTVSQLPTGMQFDSTTSEVFGIIPYQPAITKTYTFTVTATRIGKVRQNPDTISTETYPIQLDDIVVYRNYNLENTITSFRVYTSIDYIENVSGVKLYRPTDNSLWIYENYNTQLTLYSDQSVYYPWEINGWYEDELHTISAIGPTIVVIPTTIGIYNDHYDTASSSRTFTIKVIGEIDNNISWVSNSNLGYMEVEIPSNLYLEAKCDNNSKVNYSIISGELPPGLYMNSLGEISGKINQFIDPHITTFSDFEYSDFTLDNNTTTIDRSYSFEVLASDLLGSAQIAKTFTIYLSIPNSIQFSSIKIKPLLKIKHRELFRSFIYNNDIFETNSIYRNGDPNYGLQTNLEMLVYGGIETKSAAEVMSMVTQNHKRKSFRFGNIKKAVAKIPGTHDVVYEVIYVEIIDPLEIGKNHLPLNIQTSPDNVPITIDNQPFDVTIDRTNVIAYDPYSRYKQPSSISLWRQRINELGHHDRHHLPLWMRTIQDGSMVELDYVPAVTLCYCKPGTADNILLNINNHIKTTGFTFTDIHYDIDRYIINVLTDYTQDKYIYFRNDRTQIA